MRGSIQRNVEKAMSRERGEVFELRFRSGVSALIEG